MFGSVPYERRKSVLKNRMSHENPTPLELKLSYSESSTQFVLACYPLSSLECEIIQVCTQICYLLQRVKEMQN